MLKLTDTLIAEAHRRDLLRKVEQRHLEHQMMVASQGPIRYRPILAKIGNRLARWGAYLEATYGESDAATPAPTPVKFQV